MDKDLERITNIFKALSSETRLKILVGLFNQKECNIDGIACNVTIMAEKLGIAQPNVSQHLTILKNAGIIKGYKKGTHICYKIVDELTENIIKTLDLKFCE